MGNELKTYVLPLSKKFMKKHPRAGEPTGFLRKIKDKEKIHTMRGNYAFWKKRVDMINGGKGVLSLREWIGEPYKSKQLELLRFERLGIQKLEWTLLGWIIDGNQNNCGIEDFAANDGLSLEDFKAWFKDHPSEPMAIIHFTDFRY